MFKIRVSTILSSKILYRNMLKIRLKRALMVIAFAYSQQALAWSADHISIVGVDEGEDIAQTINDRYAVVHHPNKQLDHLLPVINDRTSVPMSKQARQFSSRVSYLNWLESQYPWNEIKLSGLLRIGDRSPEIHEIHSRLTLLGDSETSIQLSGIYSSDIAIAVRHFQRRHGLEADGVIGPATLKWLNVNPQRRAKLLTINMDEKMDYMANLGPRYLLVNIPAYELLLSDNGEIALRSRVIVGKPKKPTPILSSEIKSMVINPSWRVPRSILEDDLLPKLKLNGDFINQRNFTVFNYENKQVERTADEWEVLAGGTFPYRLEQMPGTNNALGRYKFYFPNNFSVYLHDTTNPKLFNNTNRALSSGCIRIEKVDELADWVANSLVDNKSLWTRLKISRNTTKWFPLNDVLPVHLVYWTAWMDDSGLSQYRDDIYALQR
ncbi:L,D-transpeptidase family protein [Moritella marina]|nr:L,D-transpeptidase family protein [Moritella marina]